MRRAKNGKPSAHPLRGDEIPTLRELQRQYPDSAFVFATERGGPFTPDASDVHLERKPGTLADALDKPVRSGRLAEKLLRHDLIVIDELGYLPFSQAGGQLLFHLISKLYESTRC